MYLLSVTTLTLESFIGEAIPPYAILSHVWGPEEVSYVSMAKPKHRSAAKLLAGYSKIEMCCKQAQKDGYRWVWVDTCCIDKRSSAELSEAINSMFVWYRRAACCYVYLFDIDVHSAPSSDEGEDEAPGLRGFGNSRWFTRGWTLQELLAPRKLVFFTRDWSPIGYMANHRYGGKRELQLPATNGFSSLGDTNVSHPPLRLQDGMEPGSETITAPLSQFYVDLTSQISFATKIPENYLVGTKALRQAPVAQRMFWASCRKTTREEDRAYSLMGLFDINMPILYGEGLEKAFTRLQHEIMLKSPDQSILMWYKTFETSYRLLAESPDCFSNSGDVVLMDPFINMSLSEKGSFWSSFTMTNLGLRITLPIFRPESKEYYSGEITYAKLNCLLDGTTHASQTVILYLVFLQTDLDGSRIFSCRRLPSPGLAPLGGQFIPTSIHLCGNDYVSIPAATVAADPFGPDDAPTSRPQRIELKIREILARVTGVSVDNVTGKTKIRDLGIDSLMALDVIGELSAAFWTSVPLTEFVQFADVESMCFYYSK